LKEKKNEIEIYCNKILNKFYQKKHEKIYDTAILKEIFIEQKTVQKSY
jgi:S-adenosylmethionine/arginine decarboxylase-like enzyme